MGLHAQCWMPRAAKCVLVARAVYRYQDEIARVRDMIVAAWPTCAQDVRTRLEAPSKRLVVEGIPPS